MSKIFELFPTHKKVAAIFIVPDHVFYSPITPHVSDFLQRESIFYAWKIYFTDEIILYPSNT